MKNIIKNIINAVLKGELSNENNEVGKNSNKIFLEMAYKVILEREIDPQGLAGWSAQLEEGLTRLELVKLLVNSPEFSGRCDSDELPDTEHNLRNDSGENSNELFLEMAYKVIFEREIEPEGLVGWSTQLQQGLTRLELVKKLINSPEFSGRCNSDKLFHAIHNSRLELVRTLLPKADVILDLGGAHPDDQKGALLNFGYPYLPKKLYILDLPPQERMFPAPEVPLQVKYDSCEIEYVYTSMADLTCFKQESFDLIWSGESIEHVTIEDAEKVFSQVYNLLKPNGKFALDTPNRRATKLQCPNGYIHPEHKVEYYYEDLLKIIKKHNFKIVETKGIIELSESIRNRQFMEDELVKNSGLNDNPENSYLFYICCMRNDS